MNINSPIDSNAVALDTRNFGMLPPHLTKDWMVGLATIKDVHVPHPTKAIFEIINSCNLDCPMCRVGQYGVNLSRVMPFDDFKMIISQINRLQTVRLNGLGESTLVREIESYIDYLFEKKLRVELISNGSGRTNIYQKILNQSGSVIISWDAAEREIFEELRRPAKWDAFVQRLQRITEGIADEKLNNMSLLFTLQKKNIHQLSKLVLKCKEWNIRNVIVNVIKDTDSEWGNRLFKEIEDECIEAHALAQQHRINLLLPSQIFGHTIHVERSHRTNSEHCAMPWKEVVIRWNGDVQVCNMFNPYVYGNIHLNSFSDIWNNAFANLFRKMVNTEKKHPYCVNCVYFEEAYSPQRIM